MAVQQTTSGSIVPTGTGTTATFDVVVQAPGPGFCVKQISVTFPYTTDDYLDTAYVYCDDDPAGSSETAVFSDTTNRTSAYTWNSPDLSYPNRYTRVRFYGTLYDSAGSVTVANNGSYTITWESSVPDSPTNLNTSDGDGSPRLSWQFRDPDNNLLVNGNFEQGNTGWTLTGAASIENVAGYDGSWRARINANGSETDHSRIRQTVTGIIPGETYAFGFMHKKLGGGNVPFILSMDWYNSSGTRIVQDVVQVYPDWEWGSNRLHVIAPVGAASLQAMIYLGQGSVADAVFDSCVVEVVSQQWDSQSAYQVQIEKPLSSPATFARASTAYNPETGEEVASGTPRYRRGYWHNLLSDNQADVETDTSGFQSAGGSTLVRDTSKAWHGSASLKVTTPGNALYEGVITTRVPIRPSTAHSYSAYLSGSGTVRLVIYYYDSAGNYIPGNSGISVTLSENWVRTDLPFTSPSNAVEAAFRVETVGTAQAIAFWVDGLQVNEGGLQSWVLPSKGKGLMVEEGTTNLLTANQSSVETDLTGFQSTGSGTITLSRDASKAWHGAASLKVVTDGIYNYQGFRLSSFPSASANTAYTGSVCLQGSGLAIVEFRDQTNNVVQTKEVTLTQSWVNVSIPLTTGALATTLDLRVYTNGAQAITFWADGLQIEQRAYSTSWTLGGTSRAAESVHVSHPPLPADWALTGVMIPNWGSTVSRSGAAVIAVTYLDNSNKFNMYYNYGNDRFALSGYVGGTYYYLQSSVVAFSKGDTVRWGIAVLSQPSGDLQAGLHLWVSINGGAVEHIVLTSLAGGSPAMTSTYIGYSPYGEQIGGVLDDVHMRGRAPASNAEVEGWLTATEPQQWEPSTVFLFPFDGTVSETGELVLDTGKVVSQNEYYDVPIETDLIGTAVYKFRVKTWDQADTESAYPPWRYWTTNAPYRASGTWESPAIYVGRGGGAASGALTWTADVPTGCTLTAEYCTSSDGSIFGAWAPVVNGGAVPPANYVKIRFSFATTYDLVTPKLNSFSVDYPLEYQPSGTWESPVIDTGVVVEAWKMTFADSKSLNGGALAFGYRVSDDGITWSNWTSWSNPLSQWKRYVQFRYVVNPSADGTASPTVSTATLTAYTAYHDTGVWESPIIDIRAIDPGDSTVEWTTTLNSGGLLVEARGRLTADEPWTAWEPVVASGSKLSFVNYLIGQLQLRVTLSRSADKGQTPELTMLKSFTDALGKRGLWTSESVDISQAKDRTTGKLATDVVLAGDRVQPKYQYSTDGGSTWSAWADVLADGTIITPANTTHVKIRYVMAGNSFDIRSATLFFDGEPTVEELIANLSPNADYDTTQLGGYVVIVNGKDAPYKWDKTNPPTQVGGNPPAFKMVETHLNRVWGVEPDNPSRVRWSDVLDVDSWPALNFIDFNPEDGGDITALFKYGSNLVVGKSNGVALLTGDRTENFAVTWLESHDLGPTGFKAVTTTDKYLTYVASDGVRFSDLTRSVRATERLLPSWASDLNHRRLNQAAITSWQHYLLVALPSAGSLTNDVVWIFDTIRNAWARTTPGTWRVSHWLRFKQYGEEILLAGDSTTGQVYQMMVGTTDDGQAVELTWKSMDFDFGYPERFKLFRDHTITVEGDAEDRTIEVVYEVAGGIDSDGNIVDNRVEYPVNPISIPAGEGETHIVRILPPTVGAILGRTLSVRLKTGAKVQNMTITFEVKGVVPGGLA